MKKEIFRDKAALKKWLISTTGIVLTSVALMGGVQDLQYQFKNPKALISAMKESAEWFPEGEYFVTYTNSEDLSNDNLDYSKMACAISFAARLTGSDEIIGGMQLLLDHLADFDYSFIINRTIPAYVTARIWVVEPTNPNELEKLKEIFHEYSAFYAFNDGSGLLTLNNARLGNGIRKTIKI